MNDLFIALYLDEDVAALLATLIHSHGFDVITTQEAGQAGNRDPEQLAYAVSQHRTIVTHNRGDFDELAREYASRGERHYGIILAVRNSPYELRNQLPLILNNVAADEMENQVRYI